MATLSVPSIDIPARQKRVPKPKLTVWEEEHAKQKDRINESIEHYTGRYENNKAYENPKMSKNWKVVSGTGNLGGMDEVVDIFVKAGPEKVAIFNGATDFRTEAKYLKQALEELKKQIEGWTKDSGDGALVHAASLKAKSVRNKKTYNPATDMFE